MPVFLLPILWRLGAAIAVGLVLWGIWHKVNYGWCNGACQDAKKEVAMLTEAVAARDASIATTQRRATALAMLWADQVGKTEDAAHIAEASRVQEFGKLADGAKSIPAGDRAHFGGVAIGLFDSARSAAGGEAAGPAAKPAEAAAAPAGSAEEFVVAMYEWAAICRSRVDEWASFYAGLQQSSGSIQ